MSGIIDGKEAPPTHPLSFEKADKELCFNRIRKELVMPNAEISIFRRRTPKGYRQSWEGVRCAVMQGGQGDIKHWAFNDLHRSAKAKWKNHVRRRQRNIASWRRAWWTCIPSPLRKMRAHRAAAM